MALELGPADYHIRVRAGGVDYFLPMRPVLPVALTQAELEALKPGPRPNGGYCETCRLCPPYGYVNAEGTLFYCDGCFGKMVKK